MTFSAARSGVTICTAEHPDVALLDLAMPHVDGIGAHPPVFSGPWPPDTKVIVFTSFSDRERIVGVLDAGAVGYLLKDAEPAELHRAIVAATQGEAPLHPLAAAQLLADRSTHAPTERLSTREREVLVLAAKGSANKQIARQLGISEKTVKGHLTHVFQALGVVDRTQAALWAERHGLLKDDGL